MDQDEIDGLISDQVESLRVDMSDYVDSQIKDLQEQIDNLLGRIKQLERGRE
jgi:hypothetical protein